MFRLWNRILRMEESRLCKQVLLWDIGNSGLGWQPNIHTKPKLRSYIKFKRDIQTEYYIECNLHKNVRSMIGQLRFRILTLHLETGRYYRKKVEERICQVCTLDEVEDEQHFLCQCTAYDNIRKEFYDYVQSINDNFIIMNDDEKFMHLMANCQKQLGKFLLEAWNVRTGIFFVR